MSTAEERQMLTLCKSWIDQGDNFDTDQFPDGAPTFDECQNYVNDSGKTGIRRRSGLFSSWSSVIFIVLALVVPLGVVAIYTDFTFQWKKKKDAIR
jgi:hypothetical protein